eukprot:8248485-Alexandrium_andersonii.AAC.1
MPKTATCLKLDARDLVAIFITTAGYNPGRALRCAWISGCDEGDSRPPAGQIIPNPTNRDESRGTRDQMARAVRGSCAANALRSKSRPPRVSRIPRPTF